MKLKCFLLFVIVVPKVSITKTPNTSTVLEGTDVNFTCKTDGAPKPTISWSRLDKNILSIKTPDGKSILMLRKVTNNKEGMYTCTAQNRGRPVERHVNLTVHGTVPTVCIAKFNYAFSELYTVVPFTYFLLLKDINVKSLERNENSSVKIIS